MTATGRYLILAAAFLGWMFSGLQMAIMNLASRSATVEFLRSGQFDPDSPLAWASLAGPRPRLQTASRSEAAEKELLQAQAPQWFAWYNSAFLFGAATGGLVFGWVGDRYGRVKAMAWSILCYSLVTGASYFAATPEQLLASRFLAALGVGGMWPAGVSLAAEAWSDVSRPTLSGLIGTAANVGIVLMGVIGYCRDITPDSWRWVMLVGAAPAGLGVAVWFVVPESPRWLAVRFEQQQPASAAGGLTASAVFRPPLLKLTILGIALGAIPLLGGWGVTAWVIAWVDKVKGPADPRAKALTSIMRAGGGAIGSLIGGWVAKLLGRRTTYFVISLCALGLSEYIYNFLDPGQQLFSLWVFLLGFVSTIFFGWLPLYLPELFPTHARATGSGVSFNFGRVLTAAGVLATGALTSLYHEDYGRAGSVTSLIYALGMVVILFAPDTSGKRLED
jgi:MFS family permease